MCLLECGCHQVCDCLVPLFGRVRVEMDAVWLCKVNAHIGKCLLLKQRIDVDQRIVWRIFGKSLVDLLDVNVGKLPDLWKKRKRIVNVGNIDFSVWRFFVQHRKDCLEFLCKSSGLCMEGGMVGQLAEQRFCLPVIVSHL